MNVISDYKVGNYGAKTDHSTNLKLQYPIKRVKKKKEQMIGLFKP